MKKNIYTDFLPDVNTTNNPLVYSDSKMKQLKKRICTKIRVK